MTNPIRFLTSNVGDILRLQVFVGPSLCTSDPRDAAT